MTNSPTAHENPVTAVPRRALAASMVAAPVLLLVGTALMPTALGQRHGSDRVKALQVLEQLAMDRGRLPAAIIVVALGLGFLIPAAIGLVQLSGGSTTAVIGATLVVVGVPMGVASNAVSVMVAYRLTDPNITPASALDAFAYDSGPAAAALFFIYLLTLLGLIVLGVTLWRQRTFSWWHAALLTLGPVIAFAAPEGLAGAPATIPFLVGMTLAARRLTAPRPDVAARGSHDAN
jgi:hypothetical protein